MFPARDPETQEIIEQVLGVVRERVPDEERGQVEPFVRLYFAGTSAEDLADSDPLNLYGLALSHWNFARQREPGKAKVRVYNPQFDQHGWQSTHTIVELVNDDMPFLVDSMRMALNRRRLTTHLIIHPVMQVRRDARGRLVDVLGDEREEEGVLTEAVMHFEVDRQTERDFLEELERDIDGVLSDVRVAVEDWRVMRAKLEEIIGELKKSPPALDPEDLAEGRAFLEWIDNNHFTFLGYREYELRERNGDYLLRSVPDSGLGILRNPGAGRTSERFSSLPPEVRKLASKPELLVVTKANSRATVHRPGYLDYIGIKRFDKQGNVVGERRFLGLYTSAAYNRVPRDIPLLRRKVTKIIERAAFPPNSHATKTLEHILDTFPRDELFQIPIDELFETALGILHLQERQRIKLFVHRDIYGRFFSCVVYVPRDRFNTQVREGIQTIMEECFQGQSTDFTVQLSESVLARLYFVIRVPTGTRPDYDLREIERRLVEVTRSWADDLYTALLDRCGEERGTQLFRRYGDGFPAGYREHYTARTAVFDIQKMETVSEADDVAMTLYRPLEAPPNILNFKLFRAGRPISLSDALPMLENMGLKAVWEHPSEIGPGGREPVWVHDFGLLHGEDVEVDLDDIRDLFQDAFDRVWHGDVESDGFNRLVLRAGLSWREIIILRACCKYLRQARFTFSLEYMERALAANPHIARLLVRLFHARFDPAVQTRGEKEVERLTGELETALDAVASLDEDRILRSILTLIQATLRTNYYQRTSEGTPKTYLSLKFDPKSVALLPEPRPAFEIFVYSPRVEGVHLRAGKVARGGLRWSDRLEDFRTEILGLVKAQIVKNAVIVPVGAKGGFVAKRLAAGGDREAIQKEGIACYQTFVRGLLDITDNLVDGRVQPPKDVVRHDEDDPYLVVAADKGTATFSDIANGIAEEYGFWLGDAFASGGSKGYDHKKMGITARGAWESVKRHFRELGLNTQTEDFTVIGIGDMLGDVFGNGMLLSRHIKLIGAFNHMHIFLDPDPDPQASYKERERLFALARSTWENYDKSLISEGGGIFPRSAKSIRLSPQVRRALDVDATVLTPNELIRTLLKAPADLLWNGGIGTYVKAQSETNADVGDRANDPVRVDASELRCRVVGEGGNLGLTQLGRIEFAANAGHIYTDAIDNSGGVDCSDHEVNIKVLLNAVVNAGDMTEKQRNRLLSEMTEEVAGLVLRNNYLQTQALSLALSQAPAMLDVHSRLIRFLERHADLDRELEGLPNNEEILERMSAGRGLVSAELAGIMAHCKILLFHRFLESELPSDPYLLSELAAYFPTPLHERFREQMTQHRLWREIISTEIANGMVNRGGTTFVFRLAEETGAETDDIARAYLVAHEVFGMKRLWSEIEGLDNKIPAQVQYRMLLEGRKLEERASRWLLRNRARPLDISATIDYFGPGVAALSESLSELVASASRETLRRAAQGLIEAGAPEGLAGRVAAFNELFSALDIVEVAKQVDKEVDEVARVYFALGEKLDLHWLRDRILVLPRENRWQTLARAALRDDLYNQERELAADVLAVESEEPDAEKRIEAWMKRNETALVRCRQILEDLKAGHAPDFAMLSVAMREIRGLRRPEAPTTSAGVAGKPREAPRKKRKGKVDETADVK
ncbi:MAG: NAD-glutamate dehydrogenase [Gammaproteobacteria bacterium]|nr:NAD-glutamate dehydrogenase [Gammaproteobacteria bacterium]NIR81871.1 NAD-glutamate dehydrogenase [Gammaproteobacteria bacterium]NIR88703.1 NAD-glutamate dehydrogenase [Gammaproteobacteria bacterium]NIU02979.1 NAD-glutamate dehydrogenase [Gammaproteobacteria bacterium]NIV50500.1 NAD-glutamate dehydrogenase [Gammaproteobacteria bacterium]